MWPFKRKLEDQLEARLRDPAVLDAQLADPVIKKAVLSFLLRLELEGVEETPENLIDIAMRNGADRDGALLLVALWARMEALR